MASGLITLWQIDGETMETVTDFIFLVSKIAADAVLKLKDACFCGGDFEKPRQHIKKKRYYFDSKGLSS